MAAALRNNIGAVVSLTTANPIASLGYAVAADKLLIDNSTNKALLVDFELTAVFGSAPVAGSIQLYAVDWTLSGVTAGPAPTSVLLARYVGSFTPQPLASNAALSILMSLDRVALSNKTDYYLYNNATGQSLSVGAVLKAQCWSPG